MCIFRKYRDIFGKPKTGVHKDRIFKTKNFEGVAKVDFVLTLIASLIIAIICILNDISFPIKVFAVILPFFIGFISHALFCVNTTINKAFIGMLE